MNKKQFVKLCKNYDKDPDLDLYELWSYNLRPYDDEEIDRTFNKIMLTDRFFPTLSKVLEMVKEIVAVEEINFDSENAVREKMEKSGIKPIWLRGEVVNQEIDEETENLFGDFNNFIKEFRNEKDNQEIEIEV